jgi:hypothetical protein
VLAHLQLVHADVFVFTAHSNGRDKAAAKLVSADFG